MKSNLLFYLFYIGISILIFLINSYIGLLLIVFSYLILFFLNYLNNKTIFNYIQFYLLSFWVLTFSQVLNIYTLANDLFFDEKVYFLFCVIITGSITLFFKVPDKNIYLFKEKLDDIDFRKLFPLLIILFLLFILGFEGVFGGIIQYIIKNLLFLSPILIASLIYLNSKNKTLPNIIFFITFYYYTSVVFNRTGFLLVPIIFFITILINDGFQFKIKEKSTMIFFSVLFLLILLVVGDLYKTSKTDNLLDFITELKFDDLYNYYEFTRYKFGSGSSIYDYFSTIEALTDDRKELGGNIFSQFFSVLTPRYFFPDKMITNISELNAMQGIIENPLYFAVFMESTYNLGLVGVFLYHFFILLIGNVMIKTITIIKNKIFFQLFLTNYYFYIIYLYILIRGPGIHFANYFLICFMGMCYFLYKSKKTTTKVNGFIN